MNTAARKPRSEPGIWVVSADLDDARRWSDRLGSAGFKAGSDTELTRVMGLQPEVVVIDPSGWESSCCRRLGELETQSYPPPAVLFLAPDPTVQLLAGPAYGYLPPSAPLRDVEAAIRCARRARKVFASHWPEICGLLPAEASVRIRKLLRRHTGIDLRKDRQVLFEAALRRRMVARLMPRIEDYAELLAHSRGDYCEAELLAQLVVVGETSFWRYSAQFLALQETLVPDLLSAAGSGGHTFRVWSAGCSTGEEAYSLAIACRQALPVSWGLEVHGTDIDRAALGRARRGSYASRSLRDLPLGLRQTYMESGERSHRVRGALRELVTFHHLNLATPAVDDWVEAHGPFHAVFCRNVLIYLSRAERVGVVDRLERSLATGGGLFLGAAESLPPSRLGLKPTRGRGCFFFRKVAPVEVPAKVARTLTAVEGEDGRARGLYALGTSRLEEEDFAGADVAFEELLRGCPEDARGHTGKALLLANRGQDDEARAHLLRAANGEPRLAEASYLEGLLAEHAGRDELALQHYQEALARDPALVMAHLNRAWIQRRLGRDQQFRAEMESAVALLRQRKPLPRWLTGGLGREALMDLALGALGERLRPGEGG